MIWTDSLGIKSEYDKIKRVIRSWNSNSHDAECCTEMHQSATFRQSPFILGLIQFPSDRLSHADAVSITTRSQTQAFIN